MIFVRLRSLSAWILMLAALPVLPAAADRGTFTSVDQTNFQITAGYAYSWVEEELSFGFPGTAVAPESERHSGGVTAALTLPISQLIGGRILATGGGGEESINRNSIFVRDSAWFWQAGVGLDVFARDPRKGHFDLGYRFLHQGSQNSSTSGLDAHSLRVAAGIFTAGIGNVPIDLELSFFYTHFVGKNSRFLNQELFSLAPEIRLYPSPRIRIDVGPSWQYRDSVGFGLEDRHEIQGVANFSWLAPGTSNGMESRIVFAAFFSGGQVIQNANSEANFGRRHCPAASHSPFSSPQSTRF